MKIAIATDNGYVSAHFGRCPAYILVEIEGGKVLRHSEIPNPGHQPGFLPVFLSQMGVNAIIAGGMGPRAQGLFAEKNIRTITGVQGRIEDVVERFLREELISGPDLCDHDAHTEGPCRHEESSGAIQETPLPQGKVCVTAKGPDLDSDIDPSFGRAAYFLIVDPNTLEFKPFPNPYAQAGHGAGIQSAQFVAGQSVSAVLTGQVGPNARQVFEAAGISVVAGQAGRVRETVMSLRKG
jgi:predicted Fe-Mo cluster-binding NifX family protein